MFAILTGRLYPPSPQEVFLVLIFVGVDLRAIVWSEGLC